MKRKLQLAIFAIGVLLSPTSRGQAINGAANTSSIVFASDVNTENGYTDLAHNITNDLLVYPNPVGGSNTRIVLDQASSGTVLVNIIDMNGVIERTFQYAPGSYELDVDMGNLPTGLYSVRVSGRDIGYHNLKVVKE